MKTHVTFEDYLNEVFMRENPTVLDDELSDAFDDWISDVDAKEIDELAIEYAEIQAAVFKFDNGIV